MSRDAQKNPVEPPQHDGLPVVCSRFRELKTWDLSHCVLRFGVYLGLPVAQA